MNESLYKENIAKDREIRKLNKDVQQYEQTILSLRHEISTVKYHTPDVSKKDAEVMAEICCTGAECGDWEPVKEYSAVGGLREDMLSYQERIQKVEAKLKSSGTDVRALRSANVALREELHGLRGVCAALAHQCRTHALRDQFKDDIIREMRRQLKQAKGKSKEVSEVLSRSVSLKSRESRDSGPREAVREQPRSRSRPRPARALGNPLSLSDDCRSPRLVLSRDDLLSPSGVAFVKLKSSTPNVSRYVELTDTCHSPDLSVILVEPSVSAPILISDDSISKIEDKVLRQCGHSPPGSNSSVAGLEETFLQQCALGHRAGVRATNCKKCVRIQLPEDVDEAIFKGKDVKSVSNDGKVKSEHKRETPNEPESIGRSSEVDSPSSSCASARAQYYQNKLLATLQILRNKEETVRVQTESLAVAEARIASLTARSNELKRDIERKGCELRTLRESVQKSKIEKSDVSITAQVQEIDNQKNIVTTLQNNLSVIEELYRECFYETAKQEGLIEMLRKSYLDVRLMDKEKSDQISRLHNVINTQKWSLDKCQDIASDVDNLKVEITNFLNSSNNDSGVWEESLAGDLTEDLHDIAGQLLRLGELLTGDCTCGLQEENEMLRQNNEVMERQIDELRLKLSDLENVIENKESADRQHLEQMRAKDSELHLIRQQLAIMENDTSERGHIYETVKMQLHQTQVLLNDKTEELTQAQAQCQRHEETIQQLAEELDQSKEVSKEYCALRGAACAAQRRVRELRTDLNKALHDCAHMDAARRSEVKTLEAALHSAQARGAALCEEARRAASDVRAWTQHCRDKHRQQETLIEQQKSQIRRLELRLDRAPADVTLTRSAAGTCAECTSAGSIGGFERADARTVPGSFDRPGRSRDEPSCSRCPRLEFPAGSFASSGSRARGRRRDTFETSASEMGSSSPPVPPERPSRMKRFLCENRMSTPGARDASVQRPERRDAHTHAQGARDAHTHTHGAHECLYCTVHTVPREACGGSVEAVLSRVECAGAALAASLRRWTRHPTLHRT